MNVVATARYIRQSPRKVRLVATAIRELSPEEAINALELMNLRAAKTVQDVIKSAIANATNNHKLPASSLRIRSLEIGEGPTLKRMRAVSRGRGVSIMKRTSHVRVVLTDEPEVLGKRKAALAAAKASNKSQAASNKKSKPAAKAATSGAKQQAASGTKSDTQKETA